MALHPCPRCKTLIPVGITYCDACRPEAEAQAAEAMERRAAFKRKQYNLAYNRRRDPQRQAFYNSKDWRTLSRAFLQSAGYKCQAKLEGCGRLAVEVHHVAPIRTPEGWERRLDWENLQAVCVACHNKLDGKTFTRKTQPGVIDLRDVMRELKE